MKNNRKKSFKNKIRLSWNLLMKNHVSNYLKRMMFLVVFIMSCYKINAYDFKVDGIFYNVLSNNDVEVTYETISFGDYNGNVTIPSTVSYSGVKYNVVAIGEYAFYGSGNYVNAITMPNSIKTIGRGAFTSLWKITSIEIPQSVATIGNEAFTDCTSLLSINIPENVTSIGDDTFENCQKLQSVTLPNSLKTIGKSVFYRCAQLKNINIPKSVLSIGDYAFEGCI